MEPEGAPPPRSARSGRHRPLSVQANETSVITREERPAPPIATEEETLDFVYQGACALPVSASTSKQAVEIVAFDMIEMPDTGEYFSEYL